jgi:hypothetical protein
MDTTEEAQATQTKVQQGLTGSQRLMIALEMSEAARELSLSRLRLQHPGWSDRDFRRELLRYAFLPDAVPEPLR